MKKTINTLITAVILTTAAAIGPNSATASSDANNPPVTTPRYTVPLYGPPSVFTTTVSEPDPATSLSDIITTTVTTPRYTYTVPLYGPPSVFTTTVSEPDETTVPDITAPPVTTMPPEVTNVPLYGPPSVFYKKADVDTNGTVNIADYCKMLNAAHGDGTFTENDIADINRDRKVDQWDIKALQNYLFGKTDSVIPVYDEEQQPQLDYGCFEAFEEDEVK